MPDQFGMPLPGEGVGANPGIASYAPQVQPGLRAVPGGLPQPSGMNPLGNQGMAQQLMNQMGQPGMGPSSQMNAAMNQMGQVPRPGMPPPGALPAMPPGGGMLGAQPPAVRPPAPNNAQQLEQLMQMYR